jgi:stage II sporulation protein AA (anti-sigma F factor antagonist)
MEFCVYDKGILTVRMPREVDHHAAAKIRSEADQVIDLYPVRRLVIDFAGTEFMDSSGIGVVIGRAKKMGYRKGDVIAVNLSGRVEKIFHISGLDELIRIESPAGCGNSGSMTGR